jgi:DNA-binding HxlR family transcriptional regulator
MIIYRLLDGPRRFGELRRLVGDPSQRSLTIQLRELEADGIVAREIFAEVRSRVEYSLTPFGQTLAPVLIAMRDWGVSFQERGRSAWASRRSPGFPQKGSKKTSISTRMDRGDPGFRTRST